MKESLAALNASLQEKKALLKQVKSMSREDVPEDDIQTQLKETTTRKNSLEGDISLLVERQEKLVEEIKAKGCI
jgi:hypothetical protein